MNLQTCAISHLVYTAASGQSVQTEVLQPLDRCTKMNCQVVRSGSGGDGILRGEIQVDLRKLNEAGFFVGHDKVKEDC